MADWQWKSRYLDSVVSGVGFLACVDHFGDINEMVFSVAPCLCVRLSINPGQNEWIPAFAGMTWGKPRRVLILLGALKIAGFFLDRQYVGCVPFVGAEVDGFALGRGMRSRSSLGASRLLPASMAAAPGSRCRSNRARRRRGRRGPGLSGCFLGARSRRC